MATESRVKFIGVKLFFIYQVCALQGLHAIKASTSMQPKTKLVIINYDKELNEFTLMF